MACPRHSLGPGARASSKHPLPAVALAVALLLLLGLAPAPSQAATVAQVRAALRQAKLNPNINIAADAWMQLLGTRWGRYLDFSGDVTLLVPANFLFVKYRFSRLKAAQTINLFNMHILKGKHSFNQLVSAPVGTKFYTKYQSRFLSKAWLPRSVRWRIGGSAAGPRTPGEVVTNMVAANVHLGSNVFVHGINSVLTPPDYKGGPFASPIFK